ncbi:MAG: 6-phosphofructokinase [Planctomycetaceae bacterium]|nr:6-phosphofructokinase [Planctomycetaceae bacterium]
MAKTTKGNVVIGQSGGPTVVINQSLVGAVEALKASNKIGKILGAHHGVKGIVKEDFIDLKKAGKALLEKVAQTPAAALGSSRDKPDEEYCRKIFGVFAKYDVRYFFYIGGNDSADTARIVSEMAAADNYDLQAFHSPKTIDNDLRVTDHCPGYGSAAKFVACAFMGDDRDSAALPGLKINVVMGRNAGWLTAASALGRQDESEGPHLVYVPEVPFITEKFVEDVRKVYAKLGRCQIAVSEGIVDEHETPIAVKLAEEMNIQLEKDTHGNVQLSGTGILGDFLSDYLKSKLKDQFGKLRVRSDTFGYLQRSFPGIASKVDAAEARMCGRKAVQFALAGEKQGSVVMVRAKGPTYRISYERADIKDVARLTKDMPREYINKAGNGVTEAFLKYARPLVGPLPVIGRLV